MAVVREFLPNYLTILISIFITTGFTLHFEGIRRFRGLSNRKFLSLTFVLINVIVFIFFSTVSENLIFRLIGMSMITSIICCFCGIELINNVSKNERRTYWLAAIFFFVNCVGLFSRALLTNIYSQITFIYDPDLIQSIFVTVNMLCFVGWSLCFIILNSERLQEDLLKAQIELEKLATTDYLTGINNNRHFFEMSEDEINRARRFEHPLSVIMFDIDHFKKVNDNYGHAIGDKVLTKVADICRNNLRSVDVLGRLGGEEFGILLPNTSKENALTVAESLREKIESIKIENLEDGFRITASFGVSELIDQDKQIKPALIRADEALYKAKENGRNSVSLFN